MYDVDKIGVGRVETDKARHSLEQQLSRVEARNPAKTLFVRNKISTISYLTPLSGALTPISWNGKFHDLPFNVCLITCLVQVFSPQHTLQYELRGCAR